MSFPRFFVPPHPLWMNTQMSQYPPPPAPEQQHYTPIYPTASPQPQLLSPAQQEQLQFSTQQLAQLSQPSYSKIEPSLADPNGHTHPANQTDQRPPITPTAADAHQKTNRLRKACDSCSIRKVKCDETGPPCKACAALDIPCTFERPSRRRGPPNRHAEAIKKRRLESPHLSGPSSPSSPTHAAQALAALSSHPTLSAESICPLDTVELLINDFFTYIHPLCPFPHEPSFREAFRKREDYSNRPFLALLASMIGALVASFPRKPRLHLKAQRKENLFPNHMHLVTRCQQVCTAARGAGYLEREDLNVYDAATSYFLGLIGAYTFRYRQGRLYFAECLTIIRSLNLHKEKEQFYTNYGGFPGSMGSSGPNTEGSREAPVDVITQELGRRIFWTVFVSNKSMAQLGATFGEVVILPPTPSEPYPPLPVEVDDIYVYPTHILEQPPGVVPLIKGFNVNVRVYQSYDILTTMEMAYGIDHVFDWERQKRVLRDCLQFCKHVLDGVPPELKVWAQAGQFGQMNQPYYPPLQEYLHMREPSLNPYEAENSSEERRRMQYEIQKANIYASHLSTRSYIVEKYWNLCEAHNRMKASSAQNSPGVAASGLDGMMRQPPTSNYELTEQEMIAERESIVKDLLVVLGSISQVNMEPNADSFTMKIRQIASTLLDAPKNRKGSVAQQAEQYLQAFLNILVKLERVSPANSDLEQPEDEESELRHWADLREYQEKFAQAGGIFGFNN